MDYEKLIGIDRSTIPARFLPEVVLEGDDKDQFLIDLGLCGQKPDPNWRRAKRIVGLWNGKGKQPIPEHSEFMGCLCGRDWYVVFDVLDESMPGVTIIADHSNGAR